MENLAKAVVKVMKAVKGMEKNSKVGTGNASYNGTKDQDVKEVFNEEMAKAGLCILPTNVRSDIRVDRWEEIDSYTKLPKTKQSVFTTVNTKYLLLHESGESIELAGYGHGIDSQDKGAGKALTYALKNCLLYTFLTPVGKIDDTETTHSEEINTPPKPQPIKLDKATAMINSATTIDILKQIYQSLPKEMQVATSAIKDNKKNELTK